MNTAITKTTIRKRSLNKTVATLQDAAGMGKVPPQAVDLEEAVLGALMIEQNALNRVIDVLHTNCFYKESHQKIFDVIHHLFHTQQPVDILTVTQELRKRADLDICGGAYYITQLTNRVASAANIEFHSRIILEKFIQRELIRISGETIREAYEETSDVLLMLDKAEQNLFAIAETNLRKNYLDIKSLVHKSLKEIEEIAKQPEGLSGVPSGFTGLDRITGGWQKSDLIIIAARPGMGKTALVLSLARNAAIKFGRPVAFFSLEMQDIQLVNRLIASETEINSTQLRRGQLSESEWRQLNAKIEPLTRAPLYIDDTPALSVFELRAKCRRLVAERKVQMIVIDYLQLMTTGESRQSGNREQEISLISRSLKSIAKELNVPVICLSQLSRDVEKRGGTKRPQLSDLRESGAIEQDADQVIFIYRPDYYGYDRDDDNNDIKGVTELIVSKNRNGNTATIQVKFIDHLTKFTDLDELDLLAVDATESTQQNSDIERITRRSRLNDINDEPGF